jgi:hypothetical protein
LFLGVNVGLRRPFVDLANAVLRARKKQHPLGDRGLTGVNMGNDPNVSDLLDIACHKLLPIRVLPTLL